MTLDPQILREALDSLNKRKARNKYHAKPCTIDGIRFDSQREGRRYLELKQLEKAGKITDLRLQVGFPIYVKDMLDKSQQLCDYVADFKYIDDSDQVVIEDVKGFRTPIYRLKKKAFQLQYGIKIRET